MAKKFMFVCLGVLALAVAYHLGAAGAVSQGTGIAVGIAAIPYSDGARLYVATDNGDVYWSGPATPWTYYGNIFGSAYAEPATWGSIKAQFKE